LAINFVVLFKHCLSPFLDAVQNLLKYLGMGACERSDKIPEGKSSHTLLLSGRFRGGVEILAKARLALDPIDQTVTMNIIVR
jgi:coatomer protein complex subunit gamma